ncbi:3-oxoacyl-ACP reductase FabG [Jatrophihabitans cynanchi]|uniref:3-oxoacyl-ACP reductase FabG n=1 Tax=Jatrophihabitans cynanchi TaxID=2944128 RepID=A0ABY7K0S7_9ACTN|nr:3-oxoacyl-ACP reductase FabG [Jatrophihabitans sp. SB3-54]WAX57182.1 3-oxoacyl-ACP reductase FabG [Jatrophihabitans sp. SB3-54]
MARTVLVTGGNRGIGLAVAQAFAANGDRVAITHRGSEPPGGLFGVRCDVTSVDEVDAAFTAVEAELGPVEVLVSNAGMTDDTLLLRMSEESFQRVVDTNLTGAYRVAKRAAQGMLKARRGRMIFVSSVVALVGSPGQANYAASKAGLIGLARSIARELGSRSITANVIAPGFIDTDMTAELGEARKAEILGTVPLKRYGTAEEIAGAALYLASDAAAYVSGVVLPVDGGLGMGI